MASFSTNLSVAVRSLREQGYRTWLSITGILVASVAIVLLVSIALGVREDIGGQIDDLGVNTLIVMPGRIEPGMFNPNLGGQSYLTEGQAVALRKVPGVLRTAPLTFAGGGVRVSDKSSFPILVATTSDWFVMRPLTMKYGRPFSDALSSERVAILGSLASTELFGKNVDPVGRPVRINQQQYRVIGVTEDQKQEQSLFSMGGLQNVVYVPYHALKESNPSQQTDRIMVQSAPDAEPKALVQSIEKVLDRSLDVEQFSVLTQEDLLKLVYKVTNILTWLLTGLTSIALFVGGVGIMTVMLMSVNERAREIGVRKTVGARSSDVFVQFLAESLMLALLGGSAGLALSYVVAIALSTFTEIRPAITTGVVMLCFGTNLVIGSLFGLLPAMSASRKDPVVSLRHD